MYHTSVIDFIRDIEDSAFYQKLQANASTQIGPQDSYEKLAILLQDIIQENPEFKNVDILFEYNPPNYGGYCDVVLVGEKDGTPVVYLVELKDWEKRPCISWSTKDGIHIDYNGHPELHPAAQIKGYTEACRDTHSACVRPSGITPVLKGVVFFTKLNKTNTGSYKARPFSDLTKEYPVYCMNDADILKQDISDVISIPNSVFCSEFIHGKFVQSTDLKIRLKDSLRKFMYSDEYGARPFVLIDEQADAFREIADAIENAMKDPSAKKKVFIVNGVPGTGKTAVAANLLLYALEKQAANNIGAGNIAFTSAPTNYDTWQKIFSDTPGIFVNAKIFNPGVNSTNGPELVNEFVAAGETDVLYQKGNIYRFNPLKWRETWEKLQNFPGFDCKIQENMHLLTIVDEAHSLVKQVDEDSNPPQTLKYTRSGNWVSIGIGPQAYYIMYANKISVFLMENKQGVLDRETTKVDDIKKWADELGIEWQEFVLEKQYRCGGSVEYIEWADALLSKFPNSNYLQWKNQFDVSVVDYPAEMEDILKNAPVTAINSVRFVSSYSVPWPTQNMNYSTKKSLQPWEKDFYIENGDGHNNPWGKCWNTKGEFVTQTTNINMLEDPLFEVGYPEEIRGWDFEYLGLLWLDDLVWRDGNWCMPVEWKNGKCKFFRVLDSAIESTRCTAEERMNEIKNSGRWIGDYIPFGFDKKVDELVDKVFWIYRILLTRALKGNVIYVKDPETREHLRELLK